MFSVRDVFKNQTILSSFNFTSVIAANIPLNRLKKIDTLCRQSKVLLTTASVYGNSGYVFNNFFKKFHIFDSDGESVKEVNIYVLIYNTILISDSIIKFS